MPVFIEDKFSNVICINHLYDFQSKNVFQIQTIDTQATISLKDRRFDEKKGDEIDVRRYPYRDSRDRKPLV